jgi:hypothetical protein
MMGGSLTQIQIISCLHQEPKDSTDLPARCLTRGPTCSLESATTYIADCLSLKFEMKISSLACRSRTHRPALIPFSSIPSQPFLFQRPRSHARLAGKSDRALNDPSSDIFQGDSPRCASRILDSRICRSRLQRLTDATWSVETSPSKGMCIAKCCIYCHLLRRKSARD